MRHHHLIKRQIDIAAGLFAQGRGQLALGAVVIFRRQHHRIDQRSVLACEIDLENRDAHFVRTEIIGNRILRHLGDVGLIGDVLERDAERQRQHAENRNDQRQLPGRVNAPLSARKAVEFRKQRHAQRDRQQVRHEQHERTLGDHHIAGRKAEADNGERRHQRRGNGHTDNGLALALDDSVAACKAGKDRDQKIEQIGLRARQNFRRRIGQRRQAHNDERDRQRRHNTDDEPFKRLAHLSRVEHAERKSQRHDRRHQRRNQHRADDNSR